MTPRQFRLLRERRREDLAHRELVQAWTTAAVINHSMLRPEDAVSPLDYMPHHRLAKPVREQSEEELEAESNFNLCVLQESARQRAANAAREKTANGK